MANLARQKGTAFETAAVEYIKCATGQEVRRNPLAGSQDIGDLNGLKVCGERITVECKNTKTLAVSDFLAQVEKESANDLTDFGIVIWKRPRIGMNLLSMGDQAVLMTLDTFTRLVNLANGVDL